MTQWVIKDDKDNFKVFTEKESEVIKDNLLSMMYPEFDDHLALIKKHFTDVTADKENGSIKFKAKIDTSEWRLSYGTKV